MVDAYCPECDVMVAIESDGMTYVRHGEAGAECSASGTPAIVTTDTIVHRGNKWLLMSKKGKVLGRHETKEEAAAQEGAIKASQHADSTTVRRFDYLAPDALAPPTKTPEGFLKVEGRISRIGIQIYQDATGAMHREYRSEDEVFAPESLASFSMMPVTNTHPTELLDAANAKDHTVGAVGESLRRDGDFVAAPLIIYDASAIADAESGRSQLSCGYSCELDPTPGVWQGQSYDAVQRNIRGNHVALVDEARAGSMASLRLDGADLPGPKWAKLDDRDAIMVVSVTDNAASHTSERTMPQSVRIDGIEIEVKDGNAATLQQAFDRAMTSTKKDAVEAALAPVKEKLDAAQKSRASLIKLVAHSFATATARADAFKAFKGDVDCPACGGSGKKDAGALPASLEKGDQEKPAMDDPDGDDGDEGEMCDYCDGKGKVTLLGEFGGKIEGLDADEEVVDGDKPEMDAPTELEVEQETENQAKEAHKDAKAHVAKTLKGFKDRLTKRDAAIANRIKRDAEHRALLEVEARKHLGADAKLDGLDALAMKKLVVAKLRPSAKLDGKSREYVSGVYDSAIAEVPTRVDSLRGALAAPSVNKPLQSGSGNARNTMIKANQDAWKRSEANAK